MADAATKPATVIDEITAIIGADCILTDPQSCAFYTQDIYTKTLPALAVIQPDSSDKLADVIAVATRYGHAVLARGGGMSYSGGYVPSEPGSILIDLHKLSQIIEINTEDMYVTVECGCTWKALHEALAGTGYRTPYWGTLSGIKATVGGSLSQNSIFWGSGRYGSAVDCVIGLEVILADGAIINTGANAKVRSAPFFRHYGPDLTGLFCCDTGALGVKTKATFQLIPQLTARRFASFDFADYPGLAGAMSAIARADLAMECFAFDPFLQKQRLQRESLMTDVKVLAGVMKASGGVVQAIKDGAKVAVSGRGFMDDVAYSLHVMVEERSESLAEDNLKRIKEICLESGGQEIENSIPKILRANPFTPMNNVLGPNGERWAPIHALVPHSKSIATIAGVKKIFSECEPVMEEHGIGAGFLFATVSTSCFVVEPVFFWPDAMEEIHRDTVESAVLKRLPGFDENLEARKAVGELRAKLLDFFCDIGAVHLQIARTYPYKDGINPSNWALVRQLKQLVDPDNRINPGSLGL